MLDAARYYIILPDGIGHGASSKPSDGLHARFPQYDYEDMVSAQYALLTQGLHVDHLRLVMGTSMGCMHTWLWGGTAIPTFMDAAMPLACLPVQIAGRNRLWRDLTMDSIRTDPQWLQGEYRSEPMQALRAAAGFSADRRQRADSDADRAADPRCGGRVPEEVHGPRASRARRERLLYQVNASRDYDPSGRPRQDLRRASCWINSADDFINPPELGIAEREVKKIKNARFILLPASDQTHGHGTHSWPAVWQQYLSELLASTEPKGRQLGPGRLADGVADPPRVAARAARAASISCTSALRSPGSMAREWPRGKSRGSCTGPKRTRMRRLTMRPRAPHQCRTCAERVARTVTVSQ